MKSNTSKIILAAGAGIAVGVLAGILFAPAKGSETRTALKGKAEEIKDQINNKVHSIDPEGILASLKARVEDGLETGKDEIKDKLLAELQALENAIENA